MTLPIVNGPTGWSRYVELRHDPEVATAATQGPQQLGIAVRARPHDVPGRGHDRRADEVVAGQSGGAHQEAQPAAKGQPADAGVPERPARHRESVGERRAVHVLPLAAAARPRTARDRVHRDGAHLAQIDDQRPFGDTVAGDAMTASANGDGQPRVTRGTDRRDDILDRPTPHERGRPVIDGPVEGPTSVVVALVAGLEEIGARRAQRVERMQQRHRVASMR